MLKSQYPQRTVQKGTWTYRLKVRAEPDASASFTCWTALEGSRPWAGAGSPSGRMEGTGATGYFFAPVFSPLAPSEDSAAMNASWGTSTRPTIFMRFLPSFCFSNSLRLREMSPP